MKELRETYFSIQTTLFQMLEGEKIELSRGKGNRSVRVLGAGSGNSEDDGMMRAHRFSANFIGRIGRIGRIGKNALYGRWRAADPVTFTLHSRHQEPGTAGCSHYSHDTHCTHSPPFAGACHMPRQRDRTRTPTGLTDYRKRIRRRAAPGCPLLVRGNLQGEQHLLPKLARRCFAATLLHSGQSDRFAAASVLETHLKIIFQISGPPSSEMPLTCISLGAYRSAECMKRQYRPASRSKATRILHDPQECSIGLESHISFVLPVHGIGGSNILKKNTSHINFQFVRWTDKVSFCRSAG